MAWVSATMADGQPVENAGQKPSAQQSKHLDNTAPDTFSAVDTLFPCGMCSAGTRSSYVHNWDCMMGISRCEKRIAEDRFKNILNNSQQEAMKQLMEKTAKTGKKLPAEPTPISPKEKDSFHKVPVHLFPATAIVAGAMVIAQGHKRPGRTMFNWRNPEEAIKETGYLSAVERHLHRYKDGEDFDEELSESAGVPISHLWAALSSLAIMIDAQETGTCIDDRNKNGKVSEMIKRLTPALPISQK